MKTERKHCNPFQEIRPFTLNDREIADVSQGCVLLRVCKTSRIKSLKFSEPFPFASQLKCPAKRGRAACLLYSGKDLYLQAFRIEL